MDTEVDPGDLVAHASHLDGLVERLGTAVSAAHTAMNGDAYGILCAFLPPIINPTGEKAKETLQAAVDGVRTISDNVRTAATAYQEGDAANAAPLESHLASARIGTTVQPGSPVAHARIGTVQQP
jgi:hypothetical protein